MKLKYVIFSLLITGSLAAQENTEEACSKTWEFGLGGTAYQFNHVSFGNYTQLDNGGYMFEMKLENAIYGISLYAAHEIEIDKFNRHFRNLYFDLSGDIGFSGKTWGDNRNRLFTVASGLQWRVGEYFHSKYIDPYIRAGTGYVYRDFVAGIEGIPSTLYNEADADRKHLIPVTVGAGINMWLNDRWGMGMKGNYLVMPYKNVANSLQGALLIMYRLGGASH